MELPRQVHSQMEFENEGTIKVWTSKAKTPH